MKKKLKTIPQLNTEDEEREFWSKHDSTEYIDWGKAKKVRFPNLKPSTKTISIRLPISLLHRIKVSANQKDVPYQTYVKLLLDRVVREKR